MNDKDEIVSPVMNSDQAKDWPLQILRLAACSLFAARAWLYCMNIGPLSTFFWHEKWLSGPLKNWFNLPWVHYAEFSEPLIIHVQHSIGILFALCAFGVWWVRPERFWVNGLVGAGTVMLAPYWLLRWVDQGYQWPMFLEHFLQWGTPLLLLLYGRLTLKRWWNVAAVFCAASFVGHGMYALGWAVPRSNGFINMTTAILPISESNAVHFLTMVGLLDLIALTPFLFARLRLVAFSYMTFWGLTTALARLVAHVTPAEAYYGLHPWLAETIVRFPHALVPLTLLIVTVRVKQRTCSPLPVSAPGLSTQIQ